MVNGRARAFEVLSLGKECRVRVRVGERVWEWESKIMLRLSAISDRQMERARVGFINVIYVPCIINAFNLSKKHNT